MKKLLVLFVFFAFVTPLFERVQVEAAYTGSSHRKSIVSQKKKGSSIVKRGRGGLLRQQSKGFVTELIHPPAFNKNVPRFVVPSEIPLDWVRPEMNLDKMIKPEDGILNEESLKHARDAAERESVSHEGGTVPKKHKPKKHKKSKKVTTETQADLPSSVETQVSAQDIKKETEAAAKAVKTTVTATATGANAKATASAGTAAVATASAGTAAVSVGTGSN